MKKTALTILLSAAAMAVAYGQTPYDAWLFSENNYEGTARSVAMGNAFTALGGDLGAVSINPAGSAVSGYSQIAITPSLTVSTNIATGVPYEGSDDPYFQTTQKSRHSRFGIPNLGFTLDLNTGRTSGLKNATIGFIINRTNSWCEDVFARGTNSQTSFLAAAAADATATIEDYNLNKLPSEEDFTYKDFIADNAYEYMPWADVVGYQSGMFSEFDTEGKKFVGATELVLDNGNVMQAGTVNQDYGRSVNGSKYEYLFNLGFNISDFIYLGANLGITSLTYDYSHYFREYVNEADMKDFKNIYYDADGNEFTTYFKDAKYTYNYSATGTGVFAKFGIIVTPGGGFRIGAAIQTPTSNTIRVQEQEKAYTKFDDTKFNGNASSPNELSEYKYNFNSPFRANFGIAYTLGSFAAFSADYELASYKGMKFKYERGNESSDYFEGMNDEIAATYGTSHYLRLGAEIKPISTLALRAGYNLSSSAERYDYYGYELPVYYGHNISLGAGYNSKGSFFADLALRYTFDTKEYFVTYNEYNGILPPEIVNIHRNLKILLTLGWRF